MAKKITTQDIADRITKRVGDEYTLVSEYVRGNHKVELLHHVCGERYSVTPNHFFYDGSRCKCQLNIKQPKDFNAEFESVSEGMYIQVTDYYRSTSKIDITHKECGETFKMTPKDFLRGNRCPNCYGNKVKTTEEFSKEVDYLTKGEFSLIGNYTNNRTNVTFFHNSTECRKAYTATPKDFLRGNRCPFCKQSKGEKLVRVILEDKGVPYEIEKTYEGLINKGKYLPFDFYLPTIDALIEYDGIQHHQPVERFGGHAKLQSQIRRDKLKDTYAREVNIPLLRIRYDDKDVRGIIDTFIAEVKQNAHHQNDGL